MRTIPRNHTNVIADIVKRATQCKVFRLENDFAGRPVDPGRAWDALSDLTFARLIENGNGKWTVHVHDNYWYKLTENTEKENTEEKR